jgi:hypothetical protein
VGLNHARLMMAAAFAALSACGGGRQRRVNTGEIPSNRVLGDQPALDPDEINDMITFLCTFTDGYDPKNPDALVLPAQCQAAAAAASSP